MMDILQQQIEYYRARAGEYDEWFYRVGRYDHGPALNQQWYDEVRQVMETLHAVGPVGEVLELACGTGIWTEQLLRIGQHIAALDASPEVIEVSRAKLKSDRVTYEQADVFAWEPDQTYDLVFFGFWLSHVPPEQVVAFLAKVARATRPGGHVFLVDSQRATHSSARDHADYQADNLYHTRRLNDGREFMIYKVFYTPETLRANLAAAGFEAAPRETAHYFIYADGIRR